ncbi:uncharacterized protein B0I36DRAFT_359771 [Microdochium trichocladiopsis]|uniref:Uncharacterized protein n=1 Tax=Microdochium trichocladiopsis TaxID=1682393 RepID=A0A9P8YFY6_9PEZI|nr:uncharacterized protein B0I36DRAFT_359771 [Microdochium trichocladiopsis]KAH7038177.1 hypothetical protein B0I36DRAFT_359771 [Microdochium trichocladiopsis]
MSSSDSEAKMNTSGASSVSAQNTDPLQLTFCRQAVRRFIFSNNIYLTNLVPSEIVDIDMMHPVVGNPSSPCSYAIRTGKLEISSGLSSAAGSARYVGGINPYATYEVDVQDISIGSDESSGEVGINLATNDDQTHLQIVAVYDRAGSPVLMRLLRAGEVIREDVLSAGPAPEPPYKLQVQFSGISLNTFYTKDGQTRFLGRIHPNDNFRDILDLRRRSTAIGARYGVLTKLPAGSQVVLNGAASYLSAGVGQADIRLITRRDGAPVFDNDRMWFSFSARGIGTGDCSQGIMSWNPSPSEFKFEGTIVFDHGDGLLRNDYASHIFYDDQSGTWKAWSCDFGGSANQEGRGPSGLVVAESKRDPRRGFSVMSASVLKDIAGQHEDPCGFFDSDSGTWRLLTTELSNGFRAQLFESESWKGPFTPIATPVNHNSTGTLIQKFGQQRFVFAGSSEPTVFVYSYPDLRELGTLKIDLPPFTPGRNSRIWPNVFPLPVGYPARYMALMMDRANFPDVQGDTWSYGALYTYWAHTEDISHDEYEFDL